MKIRELPDDINLWTEDDYREAESFLETLWEMVQNYEWKHFPITIGE